MRLAKRLLEKAALSLVMGACLTGLPSFAATQGPSQAPTASSLVGTWDLTWQTRKGPRREGYLVVSQRGNAVEAKIHGRGAVTARGTVTGETFALRGSRLAVPYRIDGVFKGNDMTGSIRVLSVKRDFAGKRRLAGR